MHNYLNYAPNGTKEVWKVQIRDQQDKVNGGNADQSQKLVVHKLADTQNIPFVNKQIELNSHNPMSKSSHSKTQVMNAFVAGWKLRYILRESWNEK